VLGISCIAFKELRVVVVAINAHGLVPQEMEFKHLFQTDEFWSAESIEMQEQVWNVSEDTFSWLHGVPTGLIFRRDRYLKA